MFGLPAGAAQQLDHAERAVGVARVDDDGRGPLPVRAAGEEARDGVAAALVVELLGVVVLGQEVVVEEDEVVVVRRQQLDGARRVFGHVEPLALELFGEPLVAQPVVVEEEDAQGAAPVRRAQPDLVQKPLDDTHVRTQIYHRAPRPDLNARGQSWHFARGLAFSA